MEEMQKEEANRVRVAACSDKTRLLAMCRNAAYEARMAAVAVVHGSPELTAQQIDHLAYNAGLEAYHRTWIGLEESEINDAK